MGHTDDMSWPTPPDPPVTPQEDEAWVERIADRIADRLADAPDDRPLLTTRQVGERLGISERTARDLLYERDGKPPRLPSVVIGDGARRVVPADLDRYVESQRC